MITTICVIVSALCAVVGLWWKMRSKQGVEHEAIESDVDSAKYDELDKFDRL